MIKQLLNLPLVLVLIGSAAVICLTGKWSPFALKVRFRIALVAAIGIFVFVQSGLTGSKPQGFLYGEEKPAFFCSWGLGLWCGLVLLRSPGKRIRITGCVFTSLFALLLFAVYWECHMWLTRP